MTDWQREFADGNERIAKQSAEFRDRIRSMNIGQCSIEQLEELKRESQARLNENREFATEAEHLLASEPLKWTADQLKLYEMVKEDVRFEEQVIAGLEYAIESRRRGTQL